MFDHVTIRVSDPPASERFYDTVLGVLQVPKTTDGFGADAAGFAEWEDFSFQPGDEPTTGLHVGFCAVTREQVERFWRAGIEAGYRSDGEPGERPEYREDYFGAFLLDPDGNSIEAVTHSGMASRKGIDHLWIRVENLDATAAFYERLADFTCFKPGSRYENRVHFVGEAASFALVNDDRPPTRNLHVAFGTDDNATVDRFHAAALAYGYEDNGEPGERLLYHPGYYAAYALDPAGANVEVVNHNRDE
jgi:catechol 2,3-dioxygenase-like lactoylglutathione lyase family enzyme